jgi:FKBP-type peptidyl-prolyl cis-trans isomerase
MRYNRQKKNVEGERMKVLAAIVLGATFLSGICFAADPARLDNAKDKINYSIGYQIGGDLQRKGIDLDTDLLVKGIRDAVGKKEPLMPPEEMRATLEELKKQATLAARKEWSEKARKNLEQGEAFLAGNGKKEGVVTLPGGLQYRVIAEGTGKSPVAADNVTVHYRGTLIDGTEFDSSYKRNKPATFRVDQVIPGWAQALPKMKEGAKWMLFVPAKLAYGARGAGSGIPPNSTLVFSVELLSVNAAAADAQTPKGKVQAPGKGKKSRIKKPAQPAP